MKALKRAFNEYKENKFKPHAAKTGAEPDL
jgi:hypothetical protein